jgi:hypothetical protein
LTIGGWGRDVVMAVVMCSVLWGACGERKQKRLVLRTNSPRDARGVPFDASPCSDLLRAGSSTPLRFAQDDIAFIW